MTTVTLGGRRFEGVTATTPADYAALAPTFAALCGTPAPTLDQLRAAVASPAGACAVIHRLLARVDRTVTRGWVASHVTDEHAAAAVFEQLARSAGLSG